MEEILTELTSEAVALVAYGLVAGLLSVLGVLAEIVGAQTFGAGDVTMAAWFAFVGVVLVAASAQIVRDKVLPQLRARRARS